MKKEKIHMYSETAYVLGLLFLALGTALVEKAGFGVSMVVAPAYLINLKLSEYFSFMSFGMAEYLLQGVLVLLTCMILRRFRLSYLFSFVTAVLYGVILDLFILLFSGIPAEMISVRMIFYVLGVPVTSLGVAFMFHTYLAPEAYELFVKEISLGFKLNMGIFKTVYDISSLLISAVMSFAFFGLGVFRGIGVGTLICALVNGAIIGIMGNFMDKRMRFSNRFPLEKYFTDKTE